MVNKNCIYLAAPLFNEMELAYNRHLKNMLDSYFDVFLPQEDGLLLRKLIESGVSQGMAERMVFDADIQAMQESDIVLAVLNGAHIDEGVSFELGFCYAAGKRCIGLKTDIRQALPTGNNPMIAQSCEKIFNSEEELMKWLSVNYNVANKTEN
ncbi:nucleoside 2-deoxyribosyltransferase [Pseudomonas stutzeri]|uniref:nucleoside 2-deoxyribosyltransferase n=1 Tax=Stutzerimonas urumqiensis TaxID=638269 RepID=UPI003DA4F39B|nr:nucleoside 2-deoxyribosyltransferase [Stutzerimonas degradans]